MPKYLQYFPKPLLDDLVRGRWLPVVGAGLSMNAKLRNGNVMPLWGQLGKSFEEDLADFSATGPVDAMSAYEHEFGRARLVERLVELLHIKTATPGDAHRAFCSIKFDLVCTTNFDFLLERQYEALRRSVTPVVDEDQLSISAGKDDTLLLKLHGDLHHPARLVVTEADYDGFLASYPLISTYLANLLITKTAVLVGYSLDDPDFRQVWHVVTQRLGRSRRRAYAIAVGAQATDAARYARRGVTLINLPGSRKKYGEILAAAFDELEEHWRNNVLDASTVTEEEPLRELRLPKDVSSRLVFFSMPLQQLAIYRDRVFPLVRSLGLVPVTADDVISPGDSVNAKIDALMDRAIAIVVEVGSAWTAAELNLAQSRARDAESSGRPVPKIIALSAGDPVIEARLERQLVISMDWSSEINPGLDRLIAELRQVVPIERQNSEPQRLLEAHEYRAAVIAAMSALEAAFRRRLGKVGWERTTRPMSMPQLLDAMLEQNALLQRPREVEEWIRLRNQVVHSNVSVTEMQARAVVEGVAAMIAQME